jgi:hypothetical protein
MRHLITLFLIALVITARAQSDYNPFSSIGKKAKIVTASDGEFEEFNYDTIQRIGSVLVNTRTKKIVKLLDANKTFTKASDNSAQSRWYSPDPLSEKFYNWSPYNFSFDNPIKFVDRDGKAPEVYINGDEADAATKQLQQSTSLTISRDATTGKISATGEAKTDADKKLQEAVNDKDVVVKVNATSSNYSANGKWFVGGSFGGSEVKDGKTITTQTLNPDQAKKITDFYGGQKGEPVLHEIIESYIGGKDSPGTPAPTFDKNSPGYAAYLSAHNKAVALDPRHINLNSSAGPDGIYISKFPYDPAIPPTLNPEILLFKF